MTNILKKKGFIFKTDMNDEITPTYRELYENNFKCKRWINGMSYVMRVYSKLL